MRFAVNFPADEQLVSEQDAAKGYSHFLLGYRHVLRNARPVEDARNGEEAQRCARVVDKITRGVNFGLS